MGQSLAQEIEVAELGVPRLTLPNILVVISTRLLEQYKRLRTLRLRLQRYVLLLMSSSQFQSNPGIHGLARSG